MPGVEPPEGAAEPPAPAAAAEPESPPPAAEPESPAPAAEPEAPAPAPAEPEAAASAAAAEPDAPAPAAEPEAPAPAAGPEAPAPAAGPGAPAPAAGPGAPAPAAGPGAPAPEGAAEPEAPAAAAEPEAAAPAAEPEAAAPAAEPESPAPAAEPEAPAPAGFGGEVDLDWRSVAWGVAACAVLVTLTGLVRAAPRTITVLAIGTLLALALDPAVTRLQRRFKGRRTPAVAAVVVALFAAAALAVFLLAPPAIDQGRRLGRDVDQVVAQIEDLPIVGDDLRKAEAAEKIQRWVEGLPDRLQGEDTPIGEAAVRLADGLLVAGFTLLVTVTLLLDGARLTRGVRRLVPPVHRERADRIGRLTYGTVGRYVAGSVLVATVAGTATLVAGLILRVPLAPLLAVWVALFDLVPQIGGAAGGIPFVLLGLTRGAGTAVACAVFFILYLQFENHVLSPMIVGRAVKLSPPATMTAALVGVSAGGVVGALLAVPVAAAAKVIYLELRPQPASPAVEAAAAST